MVEPLPSWPPLLRPMHFTPVAWTTQVWAPPPTTAVVPVREPGRLDRREVAGWRWRRCRSGPRCRGPSSSWRCRRASHRCGGSRRRSRPRLRLRAARGRRAARSEAPISVPLPSWPERGPAPALDPARSEPGAGVVVAGADRGHAGSEPDHVDGGVALGSVVPSPTWPLALLPQHLTAPPEVRAQRLGVAGGDRHDVGGEAGDGDRCQRGRRGAGRRAGRVELSPQQRTTPSALSAQVWLLPAASCGTTVGATQSARLVAPGPSVVVPGGQAVAEVAPSWST